jgi:hypothetical protein
VVVIERHEDRRETMIPAPRALTGLFAEYDIQFPFPALSVTMVEWFLSPSSMCSLPLSCFPKNITLLNQFMVVYLNAHDMLALLSINPIIKEWEQTCKVATLGNEICFGLSAGISICGCGKGGE